MTIKGMKKSLVVGLAVFGLMSYGQVFATFYTREVDVEFNFNSSLSVNIDTADIQILDLAPGTSSDSNIVDISISTNSAAGYNLSATAGWADNATTNMTHTNGTNTFTSIATNASLASLTTDNTWGYSFSDTKDGNNEYIWGNFSGLPLYTATAKELKNTNAPASDIVGFKINAKASTAQPAGDYTNKINFIAVANVPPRDWPDLFPNNYCASHAADCDSTTGKVAIQTIDSTVCSSVEAYDTQFQVTDIRDHKTYWISKLKDDKCWMTQNLDLDLESTATNVAVLSSENTDLTTYGSNGYDSSNGYSQANNVITWTPERSSTSTISTSGSISNYTNDYNNPYSVDPGDWYWIGNWDNNGVSTWYTSTTNNYLNTAGSGAGDKFSQDPYTGNGTHGHVGNYYNWSAAIASNDSSSYNASTLSNISNNPQNSICPANWRLPTTYATATDSKNEFRYLLDKYSAYVTSGSERDKTMTADPLYFVRGGNVNSSSLYDSGSGGGYWSSTVNGSNRAYYLDFYSGSILPAYSYYRLIGFSVRCVVR